MRQIDAVHLIYTTRLNNYQIAAATGVAESTVRRYRKIATEQGYSAEQLDGLAVEEFDRLFNKRVPRVKSADLPDLDALHADLREWKMPLTVWWKDQKEQYPATTPSYPYLARLLRDHLKRQPTSMRQTHYPGEEILHDFAGDTIPYTDRTTGKTARAQIFVAVTGATSLTFACATASQTTADFIGAHVPMFDYFGGVAQLLVCDNLKASHTLAYEDMARHYATVLQHTRPFRPKDKAKAEAAVQCVQDDILSRLRRETFRSIEEINAAIRPLLDRFNDAPIPGGLPSRRARFEAEERAALRPLPDVPYRYAEWMEIRKVPGDYHVPVHRHFYSVPHALVGEAVTARITDTHVEVIHRRKTVARHVRSQVLGGSTTEAAHMTDAHRAQAARKPDLLLEWAATAGPNTLRFMREQFGQDRRMLGWKPADDLKRLAGAHGEAAVEHAVGWAYAHGTANVSAIKRVLAVAERQDKQKSIAGSRLDVSARALREGRHD